MLRMTISTSAEGHHNDLERSCRHPKNLSLVGLSVKLDPLNVDTHSVDLFKANLSKDNWKYLPYGPFDTLESYQNWMRPYCSSDDPVFLAITRLNDNKAVGVASYLDIDTQNASIEVGHLNFSPLLQRSKEATEAMYLMMKWAFDNGYRRYAWRCNASNIPSRKAAQRLGLSFEGIFRQAGIVKGENRDTAWFAAIDKEWASLDRCFRSYLSKENFSATGMPIKALSAMTAPLLFKADESL